MVAIAMLYSPGRYPGWVCSARSASRKASPWPGLTRKNRLNSFVGPTLTPGRGAPVAVDAIPTSYGPAPRSGPEQTLACCHGHSALTSDEVRAPRWSSSTRPSSKATTDVQSQELLDGLASADG